jgi:hypothetical protein
MPPSEVDEHNESDVRHEQYSTTSNVTLRKILKSKKKAAFAVGDAVRLSSAKRAFAKGYRDKWTEELFRVSRIHKTRPITYSLTDYEGTEPIHGKFYSEELQKVVKDAFTIEKVLKTRRTRTGKTEYYVCWKGYSDRYNSWVDHINV